MSQLLVLGANPKRRKSRKASSGKRRKSRSPAQRAATARMIAALGRNPARKTAKRRSRRAHPVAGKRRSARRSFSAARAYSMANIVPMLKNGAIAGAGGVANDVLFGQIARFLPDSLTNPIDNGGTNYMYFGAKAATAIAMGIFGRKLPVVGPHAGRMAEGALAVLSYQLIRGAMPASVQLGAFNPVPLMRPGQRRMGAYTGTRRLGAYVPAGNIYPIGQMNPQAVPQKKLA